ncbi:MAG TPA: phosphoribosylformylglycinamidine synthase subunit PurQ [Candidatus Saccharimonadales bacterium]
MRSPNVMVLNAAGINCNDETAHAFELFGAPVEQIHISELESGDRNLADFQILALPGGFSDGDAIQAGRTLGLQLRTQLAYELNDFVDRGGLILGPCNGFQILTETGLLPTGRIEPGQPKKLSLVRNTHGRFVDNWQYLLTEKSRCLFAQPEDIGELIELPIANGEGREVGDDTSNLVNELRTMGQIVFRYATKEGLPASTFPDNPSGSEYGITGVCDPSGQILGLMPHPERFVDTKQHPNWRRGEGQVAFGGLIIEQMIKVAKEI